MVIDFGNPLMMALGLMAAAAAALQAAAVVVVVVMRLVTQPGNPAMRDHAAVVATTPYPVFWIVSKLMQLASQFKQLKPAPLRVAEVAVAYMHSQALFVLVNLGIPGALQTGPKTAQELATLAGPTTNPEWLARVLKLAAELGLVTRTRVPGLTPRGSTTRHATGSAATSLNDAWRRTTRDQGTQPVGLALTYTTGYSCNDVYSANAVTAVLCRSHPNCMVDFVQLFEDHFAPFVYFSEGIQSNTMPFELWPGSAAPGQDFWHHIRASPRHAGTFDGAMRACNHTGAKMAVEQYPWDRYDVIIDIGGGNGQFLAELLSKYSKLQGVLVDQAGQVQRGQEWWSREFQHLLPRMQFITGDMFDPCTLPEPRPGQKTLYVLKQILHDWSDADSLAILQSIRAVISEKDVALGTAALAVLETGTMETICPSLLQHRLEADMTMLMSFGDGKERDEQQSRVLLRDAGFTPGRLVATTGLMCIMEAMPTLGAQPTHEVSSAQSKTA